MKRFFRWVVLEQFELNAMRSAYEGERAVLRGSLEQLKDECNKLGAEVWRLKGEMASAGDVLKEMSPMTQGEILEGLMEGPECPEVRSVMAIVKGLREMAAGKLARAETGPELATMLRGHLAFAGAFEEMLGACFAAGRKKAGKAE